MIPDETHFLNALKDSVETGKVHDRPDLLVGIEEITELMGYALINQLEAELQQRMQMTR